MGFWWLWWLSILDTWDEATLEERHDSTVAGITLATVIGNLLESLEAHICWDSEFHLIHPLQNLWKSNLWGSMFCWVHSHNYLIFVCDRLETTWGQAGPASASELQLWVSQILGRLDHTQRSGVKRFLTSASYSTAYSGCGFFESIVHQLSMHLGIQRPPTCTHAFEVQAKARAALLCTDLGDNPEHVYGDLCGYFPRRTVQKLLKVQKVLLRELRRLVRAGQTTKKDGLNFKGIELLQACDGLLSQHQPSATAWCFTH